MFAGFRIVHLLGSGGMREVYLAEHPRLPRREVLKILPAEWTSDRNFRERSTARPIWRPRCTTRTSSGCTTGRGEADGQLWISMDYVDGTDAAETNKRRYPAGMPRQEVLRIVGAIAEALDYAHQRGLLHRDVKPANILLSQPGSGGQRILLADFGIARLLDEISGLTETNMTVGTVSYAAPEQLMDAAIDGRADQYSLAATAYHLFIGRRPIAHSKPVVVNSHHLNSAPPAPRETYPELVDLDDVLQLALAKDPNQR